MGQRVKYRLQQRFKQLQKENEEPIQVSTNTQIDAFLTPKRPKDAFNTKSIAKKPTPKKNKSSRRKSKSKRSTKKRGKKGTNRVLS